MLPKFLRTWRRRLGVLTLGAACACMGVWSCNYRTGVLIEFNRFWPSYGLVSAFDGFLITRIGLVGAESQTDDDGRTSAKISVTDDLPLKFSRGDVRTTLYEYDHIEFYVESADGKLTKISLVPYWSIVIPLTLLSAYLLLSKPRAAKPPDRV